MDTHGAGLIAKRPDRAFFIANAHVSNVRSIKNRNTLFMSLYMAFSKEAINKERLSMNGQNECILLKYMRLVLSDGNENHAETTNASSRSIMNVITQALSTYHFKDMVHSDIKEIIIAWQRAEKSNKTISNYLTQLRKIFDMATRDGVFEINPMEGIHNPKQPNETKIKKAQQNINPFTIMEISTIESADTHCISGLVMILLMIRAGLRPEEALCAYWEAINWVKKTYTVAIVKPKSEYRCAKTEKGGREIELDDTTIEMLRRHYQLTGKAQPITVSVVGRDNRSRENVTITPMFIRRKTGKPYKHPKDVQQAFLTPLLKSLRIDLRGVSQCRKTYACHALSAEVPLKWLADQLGHQDTRTLEQHYAKWIPKEGDIKPTQMIEQRLDQNHCLGVSMPPAKVMPWHRHIFQWIKSLFSK